MMWTLSPHVCRQCLGRVLESGGSFRCSGCTATCEGDPSGICGCGLRPKTVQPKRAGFRCVANPTPSPAVPAEFVILFDSEAAPAP